MTPRVTLRTCTFALLMSSALSWGATAADQVVCDISTCSKFSMSAGPLGTVSETPSSGWASSEIWKYTEDILQVTGLQPNFVLTETTGVSNAAALISNGKRVLAYNPQWIKSIADTQKWAMYGLLCHEIGHHLQGHTLLPGGSTPPTELEADNYAGFVLAKLGANEAQPISLWETLPVAGSTTHPARADRIVKVRTGWMKGGGHSAPPAKSPPQTNGYIIADSSTRRMTRRDLDALSPALLRIARNEIFARHGLVFESDDLRTYFDGRSWYVAKDRTVALSDVETANVSLIRAREQTLGGESIGAGFIFLHSSERVLSRSEIERLDATQRRFARNEIFARHGYIFNDPQLTAHFGKMKWYRGTRSDVELTFIEQQNVNLIRTLE